MIDYFSYFSNNLNGLSCTSDTAKNLAQMTLWKPNMNICLYGIPETFNIYDFFAFVKTGVCEFIKVKFARDVLNDYKNNFKTAVEEMKKKWTAETKIPNIYFGHQNFV